VPARAPDVVDQVAQQLSDQDIDTLYLFASPASDFDTLTRQAAERFPNSNTILVTTAGEIGPNGYCEDTVLATALPRARFRVTPFVIAPLTDLDGTYLSDRIVQARMQLNADVPEMPGGFGFLLVDGLSLQEDRLLSAIAPGMGALPLFGGSAGDGQSFRKTRLGLNGDVLENAAILSLVATDCETHVFSLNNLHPTETRLVVTGAVPERRLVTHINGAPAAREYARLIGKDPEQLNEFTFAAHPVVVRLGDQHHVRAIQRVNDRGELVFFSAIETGMVLRVARADDLSGHLDRALDEIARDRGPTDILACDCILRRIAAEQGQSARAVSDVLSRNNVVGFSTYGEQIGPMHVNQTMTGVALSPPRTRP